MATTVSYSIANTVDDAVNLVGFTANDVAVAIGDGSLFAPGLKSWAVTRFRGVSVPAGATITSASLSLTYNPSGPSGIGAGAGTALGRIYGVSSANVAVIAPANIPAVPKTSAYTTLTFASPTTTVDVTSVVAEIVGLTGWASGNALAFVGDPTTAVTTNLREFFDYATDPAKAAKLTITYEEGGGGTIESRTLSTGGSSTVTMRGGSRRAANLVSAGLAAVAFSGAALSTKPATLNSSGTSAASFHGSSVSSSRAQSQGSSSAAFSARLISSSALVAGGSSSAAFSSQSVKSSVLSSVGSSSTAVSGGSTWNGVFAASSGSVAEFSGQRLETREGTLTAAGESAAGFSGASVSRSALTANGTSNATFYALGQGSLYNIASASFAGFSGASSASGTLSSAGGSSTDLDATAVRDAGFSAAGGSQFLAQATATASSDFSVSGASVADFYATSGSPATFITSGISKFAARSASVNPPPTPSGRGVVVARVDRFVVADNYDRTVISIQRSRTVS